MVVRFPAGGTKVSFQALRQRHETYIENFNDFDLEWPRKGGSLLLKTFGFRNSKGILSVEIDLREVKEDYGWIEKFAFWLVDAIQQFQYL